MKLDRSGIALGRWVELIAGGRRLPRRYLYAGTYAVCGDKPY